jgi:hypothetical protein
MVPKFKAVVDICEHTGTEIFATVELGETTADRPPPALACTGAAGQTGRT